MLAKLKLLKSYLLSFGLKITFFVLILPMIFPFKRVFLLKHKLVRVYLRKKYHAVLTAHLPLDSAVLDDQTPIWVFWYQGEQTMPELVKICYNSLRGYASNRNVILVTKDNIATYLDLPDYLFDKFSRGRISFTHLSDIVRVGLLAKHGGIWFDSTILVTDLIKPEALQSPIFTIKQAREQGKFVSENRWTGFLIGANKKNPIFVNSYNFFCEYHKTDKPLIDYLLIDYVLDYVVVNNTNLNEIITNLPPSNPDLYTMSYMMNEQFDQQKLDAIVSNTQFFKLNRREKTLEKTSEGRATYYSYFKDKFIFSK